LIAANEQGVCDVAEVWVHAAPFTLLLSNKVLLLKCSVAAAILQTPC
jgi:hypothetical protein